MGLILGATSDVRHKRDIISPTSLPKKRAEVFHARLVSRRHPAIDADTTGARNGLLYRKSTRLLVMDKCGARLNLGRFHVRLVKGIDAQHLPGNGRGKLPAEKLGAEIMAIP